MQHLDPDRLVLLALDEPSLDAGESDHLTDCPSCREEVATLREVASLSAETQEVRELPAPPDRVWRQIAAEVTAPTAAAGQSAPAGRQGVRRAA
ncbi:MAG TPA: hypothetical protein VES42_22930, partial [Pilimelia sp.]|nr:hypothetical protein [Pilimelia sp.]